MSLYRISKIQEKLDILYPNCDKECHIAELKGLWILYNQNLLEVPAVFPFLENPVNLFWPQKPSKKLRSTYS